MRIQCWSLRADGIVPAPVPIQLSYEWRKTPGHFWVDIESPDPVRLDHFFGPLGLPAILHNELCSPELRARFAETGDAAAFSFPVLLNRSDGPYSSHLDVLWMPGRLITIHPEPLDRLEQMVAARAGNMLGLQEGSASAVLQRILDGFIEEIGIYTRHARTDTDAFSDALSQEQVTLDTGEFVSLKRQVALVEAAAEDQLYCLNELLAAELDLPTLPKLRPYFEQLARNLELLLRILARIEERLQDMQYFYHMLLQERAEGRLKVLTILSVLFMPPTLIAGIYGMNFEVLPELSWRWGYPYALGLMALIFGGSLFVLWWRGWFR